MAPFAPVISFYSYKGGVGRSFALANVAATLARWRFRVLCIDWDIEAPGLSHYFAPWLTGSKRGLVDLIDEFASGVEPRWQQFVSAVRVPEALPIDLISAGIRNDAYMKLVQSLDWNELYKKGFGEWLERFRAQITSGSLYDIVLIDGRTGVTDFNAIVTAQLPDILVFLFTANEQSLEGSVDIVKRARDERNSLPIDRGRLLLLPVPARFDDRVEKEISDAWRAEFLKRTSEVCDPWIVDKVDRAKLLGLTTIPYVPYWSFGEKLAVVDEQATPTSISYTIETLAALLVMNLTRTDLLVENRDAYVAAARRSGERDAVDSIDVYCSYNREGAAIGEALSDALRSRGLSTASAGSSLSFTDNVSPGLNDLVDRARNLAIIVGREFSTWQQEEAARFLRVSTEDVSAERGVFPILLPGATMEAMPAILRRLRSFSLDETKLDEIADFIENAAAQPADATISLAAEYHEDAIASAGDAFRESYERPL
ncbi:MAG: hypothetical protein WB609_01500 [Candidatus Cybelea sp.]